MPLNTENAARIKNNFSHHPPRNAAEVRDHEQAREVIKDSASMLDVFIPESREKSLMFTKLEEAMFWANAALARNKDPLAGEE